jgi:hypothetical protein
MIKYLFLSLACCFFTQLAWADSDLTSAQYTERLAMVTNVNHAGLGWPAAVIPQMLAEANWVTHRLKLPTSYPIQMTDIKDNFIGAPWFRVLHGTNRFPDTIFGAHIFDSNIPREARISALKIGIGGRFATTNFDFGFESGKLCRITRMSEPDVEYYAHDLDKLVGQPSLIDTNGAYQLATQWLAAVDVDMAALNKLKWTVNQLHYLARGATNYATLPLYYVDFGNIHHPASGNLHAFDKPLISVEILGTTKEPQNLMINDFSLSRRPLLLVTNVLDMIRATNPSVKYFENSSPFNAPIKRMRHLPDSSTNSVPP